MATAEEYATWIVQNKDKKGTPEFETVAQAYQVSRGQTQNISPVMQNIPTMRESIAEELKTRAPGVGFLAGAGAALDDAAYRVKQLFGNKLDTQETARVQANRDLIGASGEALVGNIAGNVAMTGAPAMGMQNLLTRGAATILPRAIAPAVAAAGTGATVAGVTQPVLQGESTAGNMAMGAAGGAIGDVAARGASRIVQPIMQSAPVKKLLSEGVVPTPGQATGANSIWGRVEQGLQSVPVIGQFITAARDRAGTEFNRAAINRALPAAQKGAIPNVGRAAIQQVDDVLSQGYDDVLARIGVVKIEPNFLQSTKAALGDPDLALPPDAQKRLLSIVRLQVLGRAKNGQMSADLAKRADSQLGMLAREYSSSSDADQRMLARGIRQVQSAWRNNITANATPEVRADLDNLNEAFANFIRVEKAAGMQGAKDGIFSPAQLQSAVRATDSSARKGQFAKGNALMQDLSEAATSTLSQTMPNSGTADRALLASLLGLGGAAANEYYGGPGFLSALALAPLAYSRAGSRYAVGNLVPGQQTLAELLRQSAPYAAQIGIAGANAN